MLKLLAPAWTTEKEKESAYFSIERKNKKQKKKTLNLKEKKNKKKSDFSLAKDGLSSRHRIGVP